MNCHSSCHGGGEIIKAGSTIKQALKIVFDLWELKVLNKIFTQLKLRFGSVALRLTFFKLSPFFYFNI